MLKRIEYHHTQPAGDTRNKVAFIELQREWRLFPAPDTAQIRGTSFTVFIVYLDAPCEGSFVKIVSLVDVGFSRDESSADFNEATSSSIMQCCSATKKRQTVCKSNIDNRKELRMHLHMVCSVNALRLY
jgi:hypothetical protein